MCRVKIGAQISGMHDVQNLVTASILRSKQPFTSSSLFEKISGLCEGSTIAVSDEQIMELVKKTTTTLLRANYISSCGGYYYAKPAFLLSTKNVI